MVFLTALTVVTALTGLIADIVGEIEAPPGTYHQLSDPRGAWHLGETPSADGGLGFFDSIDLSDSIDGIDRGHCWPELTVSLAQPGTVPE